MIRTVLLFLSLAVHFGLVGLAAPARAEARLAVIAATDAGDVLVPGRELSVSDAISLPAGAIVTMLREDGEIIRLAGPYQGPAGGTGSGAASGGKTDWAPLMALIAESDDESSVLGAARALDSNSDVPGQPTVWQISVDSSGPRCVRPGEIELWRRKASRTASVAVRSEQGRLSGMKWPAGDHSFKLPASFPVTEGLLLVSSGSGLRELEIHVAPGDIVDQAPGRVLAWLIDKGCRRQAVALIDMLHAGTAWR